MTLNINSQAHQLDSPYLEIPKLWLHSALLWVERLDKRWLIFIILTLNWGSFALKANEEMYFGLAKQFIDPLWIKDSFLFTEFAGTRLLFQWMAGFALQYLSFEQFCLMGRLFNFALYALALGPIFKLLRISNLAILFLIAFLWRKQQTFFAHEWVFLGFEAKTLAYVFIFAAIYLLLREKWLWATIAIVLATYFHVLVGGWFFLVFFAYHFINIKSISQSFKIGAVYTLLIAPWIYYLATETLLFKMDAETKAMLDSTYVFSRNPHHVGIFMSWEYFEKNALTGFLISVVSFFVIIWRFRKEEGIHKKLALLLIVIYTLLYVCCMVALFDHQGSFLKFYPFRIASLAFLFSSILLIKPLSNFALSLSFAKWLPGVLLLIGIGYAADNLKRNVQTMQRSTTEMDELAAFAKQNTAEDAIFAYHGFGFYVETGETSFYRKAQRDGWIDYKFVPSGGAKLLEWHLRFQELQKMEKDIDVLPKVIPNYKIDYLISANKLEKPYLKLVFENNRYKLYRIF